MKVVKLVGLGIGIWVANLVWPEIDQVLTLPVVVGLVVAVVLLALLEVSVQRQN